MVRRLSAVPGSGSGLVGTTGADGRPLPGNLQPASVREVPSRSEPGFTVLFRLEIVAILFRPAQAC